jgi:NitT/TauT family transport system ATP-binding protein
MRALPKVVVRGVAKAFRAAGGDLVNAIDGISLDVGDGEFVSVVGPSGCGKSTLLNIIAGFERASAGDILVDGRAIIAPGADRGVVFQQYALFPWLTVAGNIGFGPESLGLAAAEVRHRVERGIALAGLHGFESRYPHELSGGMRQRCALRGVLPTIQTSC